MGEEYGWLLQDWAIAGRCDGEVEGVEMSQDKLEDLVQEKGQRKDGQGGRGEADGLNS